MEVLMLWYYARNDQRFGPVEETELRRLVAVGQIARGDLVWRQDWPDWRAAEEVEGLLPPAGGTPPPRVPTPPPPPPAALLASQSPYAASPPPPGELPAWQSPYTTAPPSPASTVQYATFGQRFLAFLVDFVIMLVGSFVVAVILGALLAVARRFMTPEAVLGSNLLLNLIGLASGWLYYAFCESSSMMGTPGKRALGLVVTDLEGNRISFGRATARHFSKFISGIVFLLGYFAVLWSPQRQAWHDQIADCLVLKTR
jgi:uncharacterized RDD family membrane protein YckC